MYLYVYIHTTHAYHSFITIRFFFFSSISSPLPFLLLLSSPASFPSCAAGEAGAASFFLFCRQFDSLLVVRLAAQFGGSFLLPLRKAVLTDRLKS